jgi:hypothetical protein
LENESANEDIKEEYPSISDLQLEDEYDIPKNDNHDQRPFIDKVDIVKKQDSQSVSPSMTPEEIKKRVSRMKKGSQKNNYNRNVNKKGKKSVSVNPFW